MIASVLEGDFEFTDLIYVVRALNRINIVFCNEIILSLSCKLEDRLRLGNKNKQGLILYFSRLALSLSCKKQNQILISWQK